IGLGHTTGKEPKRDVECTDGPGPGRDGELVQVGGHGRGHLGRTLGNLVPGDLRPGGCGPWDKGWCEDGERGGGGGLVDGGPLGKGAARGAPPKWAWGSMPPAARRYSLANQ